MCPRQRPVAVRCQFKFSIAKVNLLSENLWQKDSLIFIFEYRRTPGPARRRKVNKGVVRGIGEDGGAGGQGGSEIVVTAGSRVLQLLQLLQHRQVIHSIASGPHASTSNHPVFNASRPEPQPSTTPGSHLCRLTCSPTTTNILIEILRMEINSLWC